MSKSKKDITDSISVYFFLKRLLDPITNHPAYKAGLINSRGVQVREPEEGEEDLISSLDMIVFEMREMLGSKVFNLNKYLTVRYLPDRNVSRLISGTSTKKASSQLTNLNKKIKKQSFKSNYKRKTK